VIPPGTTGANRHRPNRRFLDPVLFTGFGWPPTR
jgi:hypothetical protein